MWIGHTDFPSVYNHIVIVYGISRIYTIFQSIPHEWSCTMSWQREKGNFEGHVTTEEGMYIKTGCSPLCDEATWVSEGLLKEITSTFYSFSFVPSIMHRIESLLTDGS